MTDHIADADKKVQPAPAPMPEDDEAMCARLLFACNGHPHALIPWPHRLLHDAVDHITAIARRLAEVDVDSKDAYANYAKSGRESYARLRRAKAAEAKLQRIMAWARGRCEACGSTDARTAIFGGCRDCTYSPMNSCGVDNWTPPKEWEGGE